MLLLYLHSTMNKSNGSSDSNYYKCMRWGFYWGIAAMVWMYVVLAIALSAGIIFGCCVAMDYSTYRDLQRRLQEERRRRLEKTTVASYY